MQLAAEALSRTGIPQHSDTQETVRKMAAMKTESVLFPSVLSFLCLFCSDDADFSFVLCLSDQTPSSFEHPEAVTGTGS